jgi:hypothetical protein
MPAARRFDQKISEIAVQKPLRRHWVSRMSFGQVLVGMSQSSSRMPRPGTNT